MFTSIFILLFSCFAPSAGKPVPLEEHIHTLYRECRLEDFRLEFKVFEAALIGHYNIVQKGINKKPQLLSILDLSKPSNQRRFYVIDLKKKRMRYYTFASHGKNSGSLRAENFSNTPNSNKSSLGFFLTAETYMGKNGRSLRIDGLEPGINDKARERAIVIHPAPYTSTEHIRKYGMVGNSEGCPAIGENVSDEIIDLICEGSTFFIYAPDPGYLHTSLLLNRQLASVLLSSR